MYGVGMKRAIFKMGREALVRTRYGDDTFEVPRSPLPGSKPRDGTHYRSTSRRKRTRNSQSPAR